MVSALKSPFQFEHRPRRTAHYPYNAAAQHHLTLTPLILIISMSHHVCNVALILGSLTVANLPILQGSFFVDATHQNRSCFNNLIFCKYITYTL